ncbi:MAG TPA: hypothetical protein ENK14_09105 [Caldithrix sp.]|nr:hypothetical protein [Caldithrix sp.]
MFNKLNKFRRAEQGTTLLELVLLIIILGTALPAFLGIMGMVSTHSLQANVQQQAIVLAETKMEEIVGFKQQHWDWFKSINNFAQDINLTGGYRRVVTITHITNWGSAGIEAWEISVTVSHQLLPNGYSLITRLTKYH